MSHTLCCLSSLRASSKVANDLKYNTFSGPEYVGSGRHKLTAIN